ncbi:unnamed protein product [Owenia fusiformis]|uniref:Uncharacterized protein n=1 Tax=Owenia fusiformis TaxID=6347 RepID=A0A8J1T6M9_OWEFU|nr:unnamed protein product [Owenia fusiformis]
MLHLEINGMRHQVISGMGHQLTNSMGHQVINGMGHQVINSMEHQVINSTGYQSLEKLQWKIPYCKMKLGISSNMVLLGFLYFVQGLPYGFQTGFMPVYLRQQGISLSDITFYKLLSLPWLCKALWAPLVDKYSTKRKWLIYSMSCLVLTCAIGTIVTPKYIIMLCVVIVLLNLFVSIQDIAVDSIALEILCDHELGLGNTIQVVGYKLGSICGGGILVILADYLGWGGMFLILAVIYLEAVFFTYFLPKLRHLEALQLLTAESAESGTSNAATPLLSDADSENTASPLLNNDIQNQEHQSTTDNAESDNVFYQRKLLTKPAADSKHLRDLTRTESSEDEETIDISRLTHSYVQPSEMKDWRNKFKFLQDIWDSPGTRWMMGFVLIYKLGEQGAVGMFPLFLVDKKFSTTDIGFWTGVIGQTISIFGSIFGGWIISRFNWPPWDVLYQFCLLRFIPLGMQLWLISVWTWGIVNKNILFYSGASAMCLLLFIGGVITTATFTFMMQCSQEAPKPIQATHYSTLATMEVLGKLVFTSISGYLCDIFGYGLVYFLFIGLALTVLPYLNKVPEVLLPYVNYNEVDDKMQ